MGLAEATSSGELMVVRVAGLQQVVSYHPCVGKIIQDYCVTLCAVIHEARPVLSDVHFEIQLSEDHVICAMPQDSRLQMSLPALHAMQEAAGRSAKTRDQLEELEEEIRDGRCYLTSDSNSCIL